MFIKMHDLINQAKSKFQEKFKNNLIAAIQSKYKRQTGEVSERLTKLETYLSDVTPKLELLHQQGKYNLLSKQMKKVEELRAKTETLKELVE